MSVLFDLPTCLQLDILQGWLDFPRFTPRVRNTLTTLDTAVAHKAFRAALQDVYRLLDWGESFTGRYNPAPFINWVILRKIRFSRLCLRGFKTDTRVLQEFMVINGSTLKEIKLINSKSAMSAVMGFIASNCVALETLWLENCNITKPLTKVLKKCTTLRELRIQSACDKPRDPVESEGSGPRKESIFTNVLCPNLTKLAVLDHLTLSEVAALSAAFPNIVELELHGWSRYEPAIAALNAWRKLNKVDLSFPHANLFSSSMCAALEHSAPTLRTLNLKNYTADADLIAVQSLLSKCSKLSDICIVAPSPSQAQQDIGRVIAECCGSRLQNLRLPVAYTITSAAASAMATHCPNLIHLSAYSLPRCANHGLILEKCTKLESLNVGLDRAYESDCRLFFNNIIQHCRSLKIVYFEFRSWRWSFQDELLAIIRCNKMLRTICVDKWAMRDYSEELLSAARQAKVKFHGYDPASFCNHPR